MGTDHLPGTALWFCLCPPLSPVPLWTPTVCVGGGAPAEITSRLWGPRLGQVTSCTVSQVED